MAEISIKLFDDRQKVTGERMNDLKKRAGKAGITVLYPFDRNGVIILSESEESAEILSEHVQKKEKINFHSTLELEKPVVVVQNDGFKVTNNNGYNMSTFNESFGAFMIEVIMLSLDALIGFAKTEEAFITWFQQ